MYNFFNGSADNPASASYHKFDAEVNAVAGVTTAPYHLGSTYAGIMHPCMHLAVKFTHTLFF